MRRHTRRRWAVVTAVLGGLAAVSTGIGIRVVDAEAADHPAGYDRFYRQQVSWTPCNEADLQLECTRVTVPVDWAHPAGKTITLHVRRHRATGTRSGTVVTNPGGPGSSGAGFLPRAVKTFGKAVVDRFDLVSWDPRGVGGSAPLSCPKGADEALRKADSSPDTLAERVVQEAAVRTWVRACRAASGPVFDHVDTLSTVRDLDVLRAVLAQPKLSYLGFSYGTRIGIRYADLFPTRVGKMVLDSLVDPASDDKAFLNGQAMGAERALDAYLANCPDRAGCPFHQLSPKKSRAELVKMLKALDKRQVEQDEFVSMTAAMVGSPETWPVLDEQLTRVREGDHSEIQPSGAIGVAMRAIQCQDLPDRRTARRVIADAAVSARSWPVFGHEFTSGALCPQWSGGGVVRPRHVVAPRSAPIVVVGTTGDAPTPYEWARSVAGHLAHGRLLTRDGYGHGAYTRNDCIKAAVDRYLLDGVLPAVGTVCPG